MPKFKVTDVDDHPANIEDEEGRKDALLYGFTDGLLKKAAELDRYVLVAFCKPPEANKKGEISHFCLHTSFPTVQSLHDNNFLYWIIKHLEALWADVQKEIEETERAAKEA